MSITRRAILRRTLNSGLISLALILSACSLAEDITPPPGFQNNTFVPGAQEGSATPESTTVQTPTPTGLPLATTPPPAGTAPAQTGSPVSGHVISLTGKVTNATSGGPAEPPLTAHLYLYNSATSTIDQSLTASIGQAGEYRFDNVPADTKVTYFVMVDFAGVTYASDPVSYDGSFTSKDIPLSVYEATNDLSGLSISQVHLQYDIPAGTQVEARSLYILSNLGNKAVMVESDGRHVPFIGIPTGATNVQYELAQGGTALARATNGFALLPGADKQYGIIATYSIPYTGSLELNQPFSLPVSSETVLVPAGVRVKSDQLVDTGIQNFNGTDYHLYQGGNLATGSTLALTLSGKPGATTTISSSQQTTLLIGLLAAGLLLIGLGVFLLRRNRVRGALAESGAEAPASETDRESVMDAIIALDDQYKGACISREAYLKRRDELKRQLKELL